MNFTRTAAGKKRLLRVCDVIRHGIGIGSIPCRYQFPAQNLRNHIANCSVYAYGWKCDIRFYPRFFQYMTLEDQLQIVVHEHVHAGLMPLYQAIEPFITTKAAKERYSIGDEIVVDHMVRAWLTLLRPQIDSALRKR